MKRYLQFLIATLFFLLGLSSQLIAGVTAMEQLAKRKPDATIDLGTREGAQLVKGQWRYSDTRIIEVDFKAVGPDGQPSTMANKTYDITPQAGRVEFDDSKWESIEPTTLHKRRTNGKLAFNWYRIQITVPQRIGNFDP